QTQATVPPARARHAMAYDPSRGVISMAGGVFVVPVNGSLVWIALAELWDWNGVDWSSNPAGAPALRWHAMAFDSVRGRLVVQGGVAPEAMVTTTPTNALPLEPSSSDTWELVGAGGAGVAVGGLGCFFVAGPRLLPESLPFTGNGAFALNLVLG